MTVIECFARDPIENIATCLSLKPDRLVLVGEADKLQNCDERYKSFLSGKGLKDVRVSLAYVKENDLQDAVLVLSDIVEKGDDCVLDLWGGEEYILAAAGIIYERYKKTHSISIQQFCSDKGMFCDLDGDGFVASGTIPKITVKELISLYGGVVSPLKQQPERKYTAADIAPLWSIVTKNPRAWNKKISCLGEFEKHAGATPDSLSVRINFAQIKNSVSDFTQKKQHFDELISELSACGAVKVHRNDFDNYHYSYKNLLIGHCLNGAGNLLEYKTLFDGRALKQNGTDFFNDCLMGVNIDWDGVVHPSYSPIKDTKNEIDCIFMHGLVPLFISCKNGKIGEAELYKLNTVAERFGGKHAKKMLVTTNFHADSEDTRRSVIQRAADMGIKFVPDIADLNSQDWHNLLTDIFK